MLGGYLERPQSSQDCCLSSRLNLLLVGSAATQPCDNPACNMTCTSRAHLIEVWNRERCGGHHEGRLEGRAEHAAAAVHSLLQALPGVLLFAFAHRGGMKVHLVASLASLLWVIGTGRAMPTEAEIGWASTTEVITDPPHPHTVHII